MEREKTALVAGVSVVMAFIAALTVQYYAGADVLSVVQNPSLLSSGHAVAWAVLAVIYLGCGGALALLAMFGSEAS